jgi:hypothetical protein
LALLYSTYWRSPDWRDEMVTKTVVDALTVARRFADAIKDEPAAQHLWVVENQRNIELWLLTTPLSFDGEEPFFRILVDLRAEFQDGGIYVRLLNPSAFEEEVDLTRHVPPGATPIPLLA